MTIDSSVVRITKPVYHTSDTYGDEVFTWIQPSITKQAFDLQGSTIVGGVYSRSEEEEIDSLKAEFIGWEDASNKTFWSIEESLG